MDLYRTGRSGKQCNGKFIALTCCLKHEENTQAPPRFFSRGSVRQDSDSEGLSTEAPLQPLPANSFEHVAGAQCTVHSQLISSSVTEASTKRHAQRISQRSARPAGPTRHRPHGSRCGSPLAARASWCHDQISHTSCHSLLVGPCTRPAISQFC